LRLESPLPPSAAFNTASFFKYFFKLFLNSVSNNSYMIGNLCHLLWMPI